MSIVLDGTTGITTPGLTNTGTETIVNLTTTGNTILGDASTDTLNVGNGGLVKDASGNVGIGTASPSYMLDVYNAANAFGTSRLWNGNSGASAGAQILLGNSANYTNAYFRLNGGGNSSQAGAGSLNIGVTEVAPIAFYTTNTERMRIATSGNVGIDTTSPTGKLTVSNSGAEGIEFIPGNVSNVSTTQYYNRSGAAYTANAQNASYHSWLLSGTERARIDTASMTLSALRILISGASGIPAPVNNGDGNVGTTATGGLNLIGKGSSTDILFLNKNGITAGSVATGATTITTSSDERLKENLQPITGALDIVCQMRHETGNYKSDPSRTVAFLIAQDVDRLFPYAVEKANPDEWGVNYNWITPLHGAAITELTALVKEQQAIITTLTDRITALEAK